MLFSTPTQFAVLALCLIAGWLFGLASHPGGRKWKERFRAEEAAHQATRDELAIRDTRIREIERDRERWTSSQTVVAPVAAETTSHSNGFFGWGRDNLSRIRGIDDHTEQALRHEGIKTYAAIEALVPEGEADVESRLGLDRGRIAQQQWREQAALLRQGNDDEHASRFA
ncbi:hypothetical protein [Sphingomonas sp. 37zxx]|uniref:hypothetical protein n=1 Tax=Sphingomonas sp. 37zxx TaxID=1550073 RepID=UPI00053BE6E4|nr:hypothetical protein [Sphingomonas sp. 37zxx]